MLIHWIVIYLVASAFQHLNNLGQINNYPVGRATGFHNPSSQLDSNIRGTQRRFPPKYIENSFQAIHSTFRSLEMHSKQHYKTCIYLGHPRGTCLFEITRASVLFSQEFQMQLKVLNSENFSYSSLPHIFESENFRFPMNISLTWPGVKCEKLNFRKSLETYQISFENCTLMEAVMYEFLAVLKQQKILAKICFLEQIIYRKQSLVAPAIYPVESDTQRLRYHAQDCMQGNRSSHCISSIAQNRKRSWLRFLSLHVHCRLLQKQAMPYANIQFIFNQFTSITENIIFIKID